MVCVRAFEYAALMLPILYQDEDVVVVNKPAGLLVHRTVLDAHETTFALQMVRDQIGADVFPVHRLDRPTSGALIFALSPRSARSLAEEFSTRRVRKKYLAVVRGIPHEAFVVDYPLKEERDAVADRKARIDKAAQPAVTEVRRLDTVEFPVKVDRYPTSRYAILCAVPLTGRKHQIRRHLRHVGHPVIGDVAHGSGKHNRFFEETFGVRRLLLACTAMSFRHPLRDEIVDVKAPLAPEFKNLLCQLGWSAHVDE